MTDIVKPPIRSFRNESWKPVLGLEEKYLISTYGRLFSRIHRRLLHPVRGHAVLAGGRAVNVAELVLETHGGQPRPAPGMVAWPVDRRAKWPYSSCRWITRAEMLSELSRERTARLAMERARSPRPRPQATVIEYDVEPLGRHSRRRRFLASGVSDLVIWRSSGGTL